VILITTLDDESASVRFNYDAELVRIMKSVPVHRWDSEQKQWTTESSWVELLAKRFTEKGFSVAIDGELWRPPDPKVLAPPLEAFFKALPVHLRVPAYKALVRVLHPDTGGDNEWMQQLNKAAGK
jgi:hypothetical protein